MLEGMSDELQRPSEDEEGSGIDPQRMEKDGGQEKYERNNNCRDAKSVTRPVHGMLMAAGVLRNPLLVGASA